MRRLARPARHEGGLVHQFIVIIGISVLSGVLIAGLALPWVGLATKGASEADQAMQNFPLKLTFKPLNERTVVLDARGNVLTNFYDENRTYVKLGKISDTMQKAIVSIEDARFYEHGPIDVKGTLRAFAVNQAADATVQGGSSITQQLVKRTLLENATTKKEQEAAVAETYERKFKELRYAVWVERHLTKNEILEHYLNTAYYGDGAYGIQAAAHHYFSTTANKLNLRQSALLAGLVKNPSGFDPTNHRKVAKHRRNVVLSKMLDLHVITSKQAKKAKHSKTKLHVTHIANGCVNSEAPFFCDYLLNYLLQDKALGKTREQRKHVVYGGGLTIKTTLDPRFQRAAEKSVHGHVYPKDNAVGGLAMVVPGKGYVRALAQSRPMGNNQKKGQTFVNYTVGNRYGGPGGFFAGSTFKVFVLAQAIKQGIPLNKTIYAPPEITLDKSKFQLCGDYKAAGSWTVHNSTDSGNQTLYTGTRLSVNTFFAQLEQLTGVCKPWKLAQKMGIGVYPAHGTGATQVPSFTLGIVNVSPLEMAEAYATFAARGKHCDSTPVMSISGRNGKQIPTPTQCQRLLRPAYADAVNDVLKGVMDPGGFGQDIAPDQPSAGKTGTVAPSYAVWFCGYTPNLATASMIAGVKDNGDPANIDNTVIGGASVGSAHGSTTAGPMWGQAMKAIEKWLPNKGFHKPSVRAVEGQTVSIPSFYGYDPGHAAKELTKLGFHPQISSTVNNSAPEGTVAYTSPNYEGVTGETVYIYISSGYVPPPPPPPPTTTEPTQTEPTQTKPTQTKPTQTKPPPTTEKPPPTTEKPPHTKHTPPPGGGGGNGGG
ncbi:MAG: transglycosylase domain-containing protein [Nocardioidaceae bacterium]